MIVVRNLPGVAAIEARARLNAASRVKTDHDLDQMIMDFCRFTLGIDGNPRHVLWEAPDELFEQDEGEAVEPSAADNDDDLAEWRDDGWDVTGDDGRALFCLDLIGQALDCVSFGLASKSQIELEAMLWAANQEANRTPSAAEKARNQSFLSLGAGVRRKAS